MLDTFRKRENMRPTTGPQGSRPGSNGAMQMPSPGSSAARTESPAIKPVLLDAAPTPAPALAPAAAPAEAAQPVTTTPSTAADARPDEAPASTARLIVGPEIKLKGAEITDCDTIIVEGEVDASMDSRVVEIAEQGVFRGKVEV